MKDIKETFYNSFVVYPHYYKDTEKNKIFNIIKEYNFYDIVVFTMIFSFFAVVAYNLVEEMEEKGYMILIFSFICFCAILS